MRFNHQLNGKPMDTPYTHQHFYQMVVKEFPELKAELDEDLDLLHIQMATFARFTEAAIVAGDWPTFQRCIAIADELWRRPDPALLNALNVSYLEHLAFDGVNGKKAWSHLTFSLRRGWQEMQHYLERLAQAGQTTDKRDS